MATKLRMKKKRYDLLADWVNRFGWTRGAELGVFRGDTYLKLLETCPRLTLIGVDIWTPQPAQDADRKNGGRSYKQFDLEGYERNVRKRSARFGQRSIIIKKTTIEAASDIQDGSLDFVFIDADHTEAGVRRDIAAWRPKIRQRGILSGHDYNTADFPGVVRAVNELCKGFKLHDDHVWSVQC